MRKLLVVIGILIGFNAMANAEEDPSIKLKAIADQMIQLIEKNKDTIKKDPKFADGLVRKHLLPVIDTEYFASRTLGSSLWNSMNDQQKADFTKGYIDRVIDKYAKGLSLYDGEKFIFESAEFSKRNPTAARVKSEMKQKGETPLSIYYILSKGSGQWLITNIIVEGTDMRKSYQQQFVPRINQLGIEKFIAELNTPEVASSN